MNYEKQAQDFLDKTQTTFTAEFVKYDYHFIDDKFKRDIYKITLERQGRKMSFKYGQSVVNSNLYVIQNKNRIDLDRKLLLKYKELSIQILKFEHPEHHFIFADKIHYPEAPTAYDVLACLQKYEVGSFENFCDEFGYNNDSIKALKIYEAVKQEFQNVQILWNDQELELLRNIQ